MYRSYRPGDVIRAQVLSLGDARAFYLSTAKNELGVVVAMGRGGVPMVPLSWEVMQCPVTGAKEFRKVAKAGTVAGEDAAAAAGGTADAAEGAEEMEGAEEDGEDGAEGEGESESDTGARMDDGAGE